MSSQTTGNDIVHASHVRLAYRALLGRMPSEEEVTLQLSGVRTTGELLQVLTAAPEFTGEVSVLADAPREPAPSYLNLWSPERAEWTHPVGTLSVDGAAQVGEQGWVFFTGGSDRMLDQHTGRLELPRSWADHWSALLEFRADEAERTGVAVVNLVIPDKLAVHDAFLPDRPEVVGARPIRRLLELRPGAVLYPIDELLAAGQAFLRADTHLALEGQIAVVHATLAALGEAPLTDLPREVQAMRAGDLGGKFAPAILELEACWESYAPAVLTSDNRDDVARQHGFLGTRRVLRNEQATDPRTVVIFGESTAYPGTRTPGLAGLLAQRFREVHFVWAPFGWDAGYVEQADATVVIVETVERLLPRLPRPTFDAAGLIARATEPGPPAPESLVFDPSA